MSDIWVDPTMKSIKFGPFGEEGHVTWDDGVHTGVRQMIIRYAILVDSVQIEYDDNRYFKWFERHGHEGGTALQLIKLDYPDEHLISISGYYSVYLNRIFISSMMVKSNKRVFGPFGSKAGKYFLIPAAAGKIVGFFGKCNPFLASLGAYLEPYYPYKSIGPFGGKDGVSWDDGTFTTIRKITVVSEKTINSILIDYDNDGSLVSSQRHGGNGVGSTNVVELDNPDEYVTSVSGYYGATNSFPNAIQSLVIRTNRRVYGPFGVELGKFFSFPQTNKGKIIGFHGKCGSHLYSIGGHYITPNFYPVETVGPFGSLDGYAWDDEIHSGIKQIKIKHGACIASISTEYYNNEDSMIVPSTKHGGDREPKIDTVKLDFPDEFLTSVSGYTAVLGIHDEMTSITLQSNRRIFGPFGSIRGKYFCFPSFDGKILGFHGRSNEDHLNAIGAHMEPISNPKPSEYVEPFGGQGGDQWDDGIYTTIRQLVITCGSIVNSICIEYDKNGLSVWSTKHGQTVGEKTYKIKLDYPDEFLISFSGAYDENYSNSTGIQSLRIQSNKRRYGPFGFGKGNKEFSLASYGKIIGFHGKCGDYLYSIGAYLKPIAMSYKYKIIEAQGAQGGELWDDGIYTTIRQLIIGSGTIVDSIQIEYDRYGHSVWSARHGGSGGHKHTIIMEFPSEFLISVSGTYGEDENGAEIVKSIKFRSNKRTYGPFGSNIGNQFLLESYGENIIGFHGKCGLYLDAIGAYTAPISKF